METNTKFVEMNENELKAIAEDKLKSEDEQIMSLIRSANIWGNTIKASQLHFISGIVYNLNDQINSFEISQLSRSYANRCQLIDSIVIDREKRCLDINWMYQYGWLLYKCFHPHSYRFNNDNYITEFDQSIRDRICQLIIEKMRLVISNNDEISIITKENADLDMEILYYFTQLLDTYRIKIDKADLQLLKQRFEQSRKYFPNYYFTKSVSDMLAKRSANENSKQK